MATTNVKSFMKKFNARYERLAIGAAAANSGFISNLIWGSLVWDPGSVAAGAQVSTPVTVAGAAMGDYVRASFSLDLQLLTLNGYVESAGTVRVCLQNHTAGAVDLASGTLTVAVTRVQVTS